jgi:hypothetical protein
MENETCPDLNMLSQLLVGDLEEGKRKEVLSHIRGCFSCAVLYIDAKAVMEELNETST